MNVWVSIREQNTFSNNNFTKYVQLLTDRCLASWHNDDQLHQFHSNFSPGS